MLVKWISMWLWWYEQAYDPHHDDTGETLVITGVGQHLPRSDGERNLTPDQEVHCADVLPSDHFLCEDVPS